ncbi:MAG: hypothetical protein QM793_01000 [Muricomes sp.]
MNDKGRSVLRIVAGLYLAYLGITMIRGVLEDRPENMVFIIVIAAIFAILGTFFVIWAAKGMLDNRDQEPPQEQDNSEYIEDAEEKGRIPFWKLQKTMKRNIRSNKLCV